MEPAAVTSDDVLLAGLHPGQLFHVGVVTRDIDQTMRELSESLGIGWKGGLPAMMELTIFGEDRTLEMRIAHSLEGPPYIELIQAVEGTPWDPARPGVHHLCYWSDDPQPICARLEAAGRRRVLGKPGAASGYFQSPTGPLVEVIGRELRDRLAAWLSRGGHESMTGTRAPASRP